MDTKHFILVVYDISSDKRRTKLHDRLLDFGTPVQYSVFEFLLASVEIEKMRKAIFKVIHPKVDHVRFYHLCATCAAKIETTAGKQIITQAPQAVVI